MKSTAASEERMFRLNLREDFLSKVDGVESFSAFASDLIERSTLAADKVTSRLGNIPLSLFFFLSRTFESFDSGLCISSVLDVEDRQFREASDLISLPLPKGEGLNSCD